MGARTRSSTGIDPKTVPLRDPNAAPERLARGARGSQRAHVAANPNTPLNTLVELAKKVPHLVIQNPALPILALEHLGDARINAIYQELLTWEQAQVLAMLPVSRRVYWAYVLLLERRAAMWQHVREVRNDPPRETADVVVLREVASALQSHVIDQDGIAPRLDPTKVVHANLRVVQLYNQVYGHGKSTPVDPTDWVERYSRNKMISEVPYEERREHLNFLRLLRDWTAEEYQQRLDNLLIPTAENQYPTR